MKIDEIISITKVGRRTTIDIAVDGDHLFLANHILVHNSASGDTNDISEENIQGGISKIQSADNVLGFIPNAQNRDMHLLRAKFLKTRDSSGVGSYIDFKVDWSTLTFSPWETNGGDIDYSKHIKSNHPQVSRSRPVAEDIKLPKKKDNSESKEPESTTEENGSKTRSIIKGLGSKKSSINKTLKLI